MDDEGRDSDAKAPWEGLRSWYREVRRRLSLPRPPMTAADDVPAGAEPVCPRCVLRRPALAQRCPNCGEIVSPYATMMPFVWIFVWGPGLQRVVRQERLSRLLWAGLFVSAIGFLSSSLATGFGIGAGFGIGRVVWPEARPPWQVGLLHFLTWLGFGAGYMLAGLQMLETSCRKWGTWREPPAPEEGSAAES